MQGDVAVGLWLWLLIGNVDIHRTRDSSSPVANAVGEGIITHKARVRSVIECAVGVE